MPTSAFVGLKPDEDPKPLIDLATSVLVPGSKLHLVSLVRVGTEDDEPARLKATTSWLDEVATPLRAAGYEVETSAQVTVGAGSDIVHAAGELGVDLIVIGLGHRSRVGKALMGSDAQRVLLSADRPVLCAHVN